MVIASKIKSSLCAWLLAMVVVLGLAENRAWGFFEQSQPAPGKTALATPEAIGENYDASRYDASGYAVAPIRGAAGRSAISVGDDLSSAAGQTVWRHVPDGHPALANAQLGVVRPYGAADDLPLDVRVLAHDTGYTKGSGLTSWTVDKAWAVDRQARMGGTIIETTAPQGSVWFNQAAKGVEAQVLIPGNMTGTVLRP